MNPASPVLGPGGIVSSSEQSIVPCNAIAFDKSMVFIIESYTMMMFTLSHDIIDYSFFVAVRY